MTAPGSEDAHARLPGVVRRSRATEQGSGTVLVLAGCAVLVLVLVVVSAGIGLIADVHRARSAADLAALAAAAPLLAGAPPDCTTAARIAAANGARLASCAALADGSVLVDVEVLVRGAGVVTVAGGWPAVVSGRARSGVSGERP